MSKLALSITGALLIAALGGCSGAKSPDAVSSDVASAQAKASTEVADAQKDAAKDEGSAQAKVNDQVNDLNKTDAKGAYDVAMAKADGDHTVASKECESLSGDAKKACTDQADAKYELAKANAKATFAASKPQ